MQRLYSLILVALLLGVAPLKAQNNQPVDPPADTSAAPAGEDSQAKDTTASSKPAPAKGSGTPEVRGEYQPREKISEDGGVSFPADI